jgi:hypothetical protein
MKNFIVVTTIALTAYVDASQAQDVSPVTSNAAPQAAQSVSATSAAATQGLGDLEAMTFDCPKAGLNAAAREAAKAPSQGTYQFSYFKIIHDAHHAFYEVHFRSNYQGEPELRYCVAMYCQQGWDPRTSKTQVTLMSNERRRGAAAHQSACGAHSVNGKKKRQR